jgi:hypothetical protein
MAWHEVLQRNSFIDNRSPWRGGKATLRLPPRPQCFVRSSPKRACREKSIAHGTTGYRPSLTFHGVWSPVRRSLVSVERLPPDEISK